MSNRLKMANIHAIIGLLEQKWSYRRISRELGVDRDTVARYDRLRRNWYVMGSGLVSCIVRLIDSPAYRRIMHA